MAKASTLTDAQKIARTAEKAAKFKEIGSKRLNKALDAIAGMMALTNKNSYVATPEQVKVIIDALNAQTTKLERAFAGDKVSAGGIEL